METGELPETLVAMANASVAENPDADVASEIWMDSITVYAAEKLLAFAGRTSRSASPTKDAPPPPPPLALVVDGVTHSVQGGAMAVTLHCLQESSPERRNFILNVHVDAAILQRCATLPVPRNDLLAILG